MIRILTVCLGNICRSPLAEGILREKLRESGIAAYIDSCGTAAYHEGEGADPRSAGIARQHGIDLSSHSARAFDVSDFDEFDLILAMDQSNYRQVLSLARDDADRAKVRMMMAGAGKLTGEDVPDPYYGGPDGFERVFRMLDRSADLLVSELETPEAS